MSIISMLSAAFFAIVAFIVVTVVVIGMKHELYDETVEEVEEVGKEFKEISLDQFSFTEKAQRKVEEVQTQVVKMKSPTIESWMVPREQES